ncbi:MAG: hypothetical protein EKK54_11630 [Neisseriaceae bacterium]|nr:MAG: hypothetical protein EKK54_11630 [Neisseriaceae bacterium]
MKPILYSLLTIGMLSACTSGNVAQSNSVVPPTITAVNTGPLNGNFNQSLFSTYINFTANQTISNWQFGFYVARTFYTYIDPNPAESQNDANTQMVMQICEMPAASTCSTLQYLKAPSVTQNDLSAGYTNILATTTPFTLLAGKNYQVKITNSNQWSINNISSAPQSLFFIVNGQILNTTTESSIYNLNINEQANQAAIASFNQNNWNVNTNLNVESSIIVPSPVNYAAGIGTYTIPANVSIHNAFNSDNTVADFFQEYLANDLKITASIDNSGAANSGIVIQQISNPSTINNNPEGYQITINGNQIIINVMNNAGAFYALQTLRQLWNVNSGTINQATITDYPRFAYRGILLDSSRHFFSVAEVESLVDIAATHKLNTLHWHLSDDEGTRINLQLNNMAAYLRGYGNSMTGMMLNQANLDPTNYLNQVYASVNTGYSGMYSNSDITNIISYANQRNITIIPEIDSPGHARALIKALPDALIDPNDHSQYFTSEGYTDDALPVCTYGTDITVGPKFTQVYNQLYTTLNNLFKNQKPLNPANFIANEISVGGDEVADQTWYTPQDASCLQNTEFAALSALEKEHLFFKKFAAQNPNLKVSGWQQFVQTTESALGRQIVAANQVGHVWIWNESTGGLPQAVTLAQAGYPVVLDYSNDTYFDLAYTQSIYEPGFYWAGYNNTYTALQSAVDATSTINAIGPQYQGNIKGLEGTLWSENMPTYQHLVYMATPKMAGLAEASWSPASTTNGTGNTASYPNWQSLARRLGCGAMAASGQYQGFLTYLSKIYGIHYRGYPNGINLEAPQACN